MSEQVQAVLDQMVPALRDLMDKGIFSQSEIHAIVKRRRASEYLLRRRIVRKSDFARYIEAEENLEKLRSLRNKQLLIKKTNASKEHEEHEPQQGDKKSARSSSSSIGDASIVQHIHFLFIRAKRKFNYDLTWHIKHAEFAKESLSFIMLGKIYAEALQVHPRNGSLWIEAASHEYFGNIESKNTLGISGAGAIKNARVLLQRGLRVNKESKELWLQSFSLELHYMQKLRGRRELLQLDSKKNKQQKTMIANEQDEEVKEENKQDSLSIETLYKEAKLPRIIYKNAIKAISDDVSFRLQFLDCCKLFPQTEVVEDEIMSTIKQDFENLEDAWIARAQYLLDSNTPKNEEIGFLNASLDGNDADVEDVDNSNGNSVVISNNRKRKVDEVERNKPFGNNILHLLSEATSSISTPKMYVESISFLREYMLHLTERNLDDNKSDDFNDQMTAIIKFIVLLLNKSKDNNIVSPDLAIQTADVLVEIARPLDAAKSLERMINDHASCKNNPDCWIKWAEVSEKIEMSVPKHIPRKILRNALIIIPIHESGHYKLLSHLFMDILNDTSLDSSVQDHPKNNELPSLFQRLILLNHQQKENKSEETMDDMCLASLSLAYFKHNFAKGDVHAAQKIYNQVIFNSNYTKYGAKTQYELEAMTSFFDACISMELSLKNNSTNQIRCRNSLLKLYDEAINFFLHRGHDKLAETFTKRKHKDLSSYGQIM